MYTSYYIYALVHISPCLRELLDNPEKFYADKEGQGKKHAQFIEMPVTDNSLLKTSFTPTLVATQEYYKKLRNYIILTENYTYYTYSIVEPQSFRQSFYNLFFAKWLWIFKL